MLNRQYAVDAVSQSEDIASKILEASSASQISSTCGSVASFLQSCPPDQCRHFFSLAFPSLICKVFGFGESSSHSPSLRSSSCGWIDVVNRTNDANLTSAVFSLLSPTGVLFQSIAAADRNFSVTYVFPAERLPEWSRLMLANETYVQALNLLCPLFRKRIVESLTRSLSSYQLQLNIFEYYVFWFAYYPICKENDEPTTVASAKKRTKFNLENWTISCRPITKSEGLKNSSNVYLQLLYAYLQAFVPLHNLHSDAGVVRSSLLHYDSDDGGGLLRERAEFFLDVLVNYWLVNNDSTPLLSKIGKSYGLLFVGQGETPPSVQVSPMVKLLVEYFTYCSIGRTERRDDITCTKIGWVLSPSSSGSSYSSYVSPSSSLCFQRAVYRYILRAFLFSPVSVSMKNISGIFSVWTSVLEPWKITTETFSEFESLADKSVKAPQNSDVKHITSCYSGQWESYVLSNYLFYTSLVMHFVGFSHKILPTDPHAILQMLFKIVDILTSSSELLDLLRKIHSSFHLKQNGSSKSLLSSVCKYDPLIHEQLQDWEEGLSETEADGSFLHQNWNKSLKFFSDREDSGQQLFKLFIMRAEAVLHTGSATGLAESLQRIDFLKERLTFLFGSNSAWSLRCSSQNHPQPQLRDELFTPTKANKSNYSIDKMKRPFSCDEIKWLAKLLLNLSCWLNENLGLDGAITQNMEQKKHPTIDITTSVTNVSGAKDTWKVICLAVWLWCLMLLTSLRNWMRLRGLRINLRVFASKKLLTALVLLFIFLTVLRMAFGSYV